MIILDKPFVSDFLVDTVIRNSYPVLNNETAVMFDSENKMNLISSENAVQHLNETEYPKLYTNSENSGEWIINHLNGHKPAHQIELFKDKVKFRKLIKSLYPDFMYREVTLQELDYLDVDTLQRPFVIKPSIGFFSIAVKIVFENDDWDMVKNHLVREIKRFENSYPEQVLATSRLIIEEYIRGDEFAFDAYFDENGNPVILNILKHLYSSETDTRDRVYISSKEVIEGNIELFSSFLKDVGNLAGLKNFPLHTEVRVTEDGDVIPVEINPLRFGGWCTTADVTYFAYGINSYEYYLNGLKPDWGEVLRNKDDLLYAVIVLDNSTGIDSGSIKSFDYDKLLSHFKQPLELRQTDYKNFHVFGFLFTEMKNSEFNELEYILNSDLKEFISL